MLATLPFSLFHVSLVRYEIMSDVALYDKQCMAVAELYKWCANCKEHYNTCSLSRVDVIH